jgi:hypothetical protein
MTDWKDKPWDDRIYGLELSDSEKGRLVNLILDLPEADRERAVPKVETIALEALRDRLAGEIGLAWGRDRVEGKDELLTALQQRLAVLQQKEERLGHGLRSGRAINLKAAFPLPQG